MIATFLALVTAYTLQNTYPRVMEIVEIDDKRETAICVDATGLEWSFTEPEDLDVGDLVICTMYNNRTRETIVDDEIINVAWSGYWIYNGELFTVDMD